jgi:hypothetical protein
MISEGHAIALHDSKHFSYLGDIAVHDGCPNARLD